MLVVVLGGRTALLLAVLAAQAVQSGLAADIIKLWLEARIGADQARYCSVGGHGSIQCIAKYSAEPCNSFYTEWLPTGDASGKLRFPNGKCLMASANLSRPSAAFDHLAQAGRCARSLDPLQTFVLTETGRVRLSGPPYLELRHFRADLVSFAERGDIVASKKCGEGASGAEVRGFWVAYAFVCLLLLVYAPVCLYNAGAFGVFCVRWARHAFSDARLVCFTCAWSDSSTDPIRQLAADLRAARLHRCGRFFTMLGTFLLCSFAWRFFPYLPFHPEEYDAVTAYFSPQSALDVMVAIPCIVACLGMLLLHFSHRQHILIVADAFNACLSSAWVWHYFAVMHRLQDCQGFSHQLSSSWVPACRIAQAWALGNAKLTSVLAIVVSIAEHVILASSPCDDYGLGVMSHNAALCLLIVGLAWSAELPAEHEAFARVEVPNTKHSEALLSKLLSRFCDAVVSLDESLNIAQRAPKLGGILLRSPAFGDPAIGRGPIPFTKIVHPEDHELLDTFIASCSSMDDAETAPSVHVRLLDSHGGVEPVMIVGGTLGQGEGTGAVQHVLGINMLADGPTPEQAEDTDLGLAQRWCSAPLPSVVGRSSASSLEAPDSSLELTLSFRAIGGCVTAAACNDPMAMSGFYDLAMLGIEFQKHFWDQQAWISWFNGMMQQVLAGEVALPCESRLGPMFLRLGKQQVMMDVAVCLPEKTQRMEDYSVVVRMTRAKSAPSRRQEILAQRRAARPNIVNI